MNEKIFNFDFFQKTNLHTITMIETHLLTNFNVVKKKEKYFILFLVVSIFLFYTKENKKTSFLNKIVIFLSNHVKNRQKVCFYHGYGVIFFWKKSKLKIFSFILHFHFCPIVLIKFVFVQKLLQFTFDKNDFKKSIFFVLTTLKFVKKCVSIMVMVYELFFWKK